MHQLLQNFLESLPVLLVLGGLIGFVLLVVHLQEKERDRLAALWEPVMEGAFDYVVYGEYDYVRREGSMSKRDVTYVMKTTAVHFVDGRACVAENRLDMPFPTGTQIRVLRNGLGQYRVDQI